jgi:two-component system response regulator
MRNHMILLVEDNADDEALTLRAFRKNQLETEIIIARDGQEALDILFATGTYAGQERALPELVLLDLKLPKVDGLEVLRRLRSEDGTRLLPVVIMTTSDEEQDRLRSYSLHANSFIRKPVDYNQFADTVRQIGAYWLVLNEPPPPGRT